MNRDYFWLTDAQFAKLKPHLPTDTRRKPRVDDRRVISDIIHVSKSGGRWVDAPVAYGPRKTLYNAPSVGQQRAYGATSFMPSPVRINHRPSFSSILRRACASLRGRG